ncbi:phosphoglycerate mutase [Sclerotinia borealis F-4128]|uniref:Phosphoglycerate mutase n=1 Tax=Sclerotinia borealis (strain F-4128) TaxID=1432307 RepID=W9C9R1_SCLBF|nr:phosphoglycerate mutase [Sclerotinia borealis F-4128]
MTSPRVFIIRHGETEWSLDGRHTGTTELPLTANGEKRIRATGRALIGDDRLIVPRNLAHIYVSPRKRAQKTLELLEVGCADKLPWEERRKHADSGIRTTATVEITPDIREWDYGAYEGITSPAIQALRKKQNLPPWDIWRDGCPSGESPSQVSARIDRLIADIRSKYHEPVLNKDRDKVKEAGPGDVLIVAHGHILRAFAMRWVGKTLMDGPTFLLEAGGVGTLSYEHRNIGEPAILLGGAFMVDVVENSVGDERRGRGGIEDGG